MGWSTSYVDHRTCGYRGFSTNWCGVSTWSTSDMPIIRSICTVYIEVWRGVPLITVLFMAIGHATAVF